jgi:hypothetical protein
MARKKRKGRRPKRQPSPIVVLRDLSPSEKRAALRKEKGDRWEDWNTYYATYDERQARLRKERAEMDAILAGLDRERG